MAAEISLRPETDLGQEILDKLEEQTGEKPMEVMDDAIRRYYLSATDDDVDAFDLVLDHLEGPRREHVTNLAGQRGD